MRQRPTYEELEQKIQILEAESARGQEAEARYRNLGAFAAPRDHRERAPARARRTGDYHRKHRRRPHGPGRGLAFRLPQRRRRQLDGVRREDVLGKNHWEIYSSARGTSLEAHYRKAAAGEPQDFEIYWPPWQRWFHSRVYPRPGGGITVYFLDITASQRAEETLRASQEQLLQARQLVEAVTTGTKVLIATVDREFRYTFFNQAHQDRGRAGTKAPHGEGHRNRHEPDGSAGRHAGRTGEGAGGLGSRAERRNDRRYGRVR
ncbi:MAG: PAS domain-containing protein [Candidatus Competibacteraceae bacterium]